MSPGAAKGARGTFAILVAISLLALALRLYRLDAQSVWPDDFLSVWHLKASTAWTCVRLMQWLLPEQAQGPIYYILNYYWGQIVGQNVTLLRLLPVFFGVAAVPSIYLLGSYLYGRRAGLIAALCLALSPQHIWVSQEIRAYGLVMPLVIVSLYTLLRAARSEAWDSSVRWHPWGMLHVLTNALLLWTHAFMIFFLMVEGCFLLIYSRRMFRQTIAWMGCHALLLMVWAYWMFQIPYTHDLAPGPPTLSEVCSTLSASDTVSGNRELLPPWKTRKLDSMSAGVRHLLSIRPAMDYSLRAVYCSPLLLLIPLMLARRRRVLKGPPVAATQNAVLLLLLFVLPGLTLSALALLTQRPFLTPMYIMYNSVSVYIVIGAILGGIGFLRARYLALAGVVVLYGYQVALLVPFTTRTDWKSAARYITDKGSPDDLVLNLQYFWPADYICCYMRDNRVPVRRVTTFQAACDQSAAFLEDAKADRNVWIAFDQAFIGWLYPGFDQVRTVSEALAERGLQCSYVEFPGQYNLILFRVSPDPGSIRALAPKPVLSLTPIDYEALLHELGVNPPDVACRDKYVAALRNEVMIWPPMTTFFCVMHSMDLLAAHQPELSEAMARAALVRKPTFGLGHFALGLARAAQHDDDGAMAAFGASFREHPGLRALFARYVSALCETQCYDKARAESDELERMGFLMTPALYETCRVRRGTK